MVKFTFFPALFLSFITSVAFAQSKEIILNGVLAVSTGEVFPYKLVLSESDGIVNGYSVTFKEPDDTKTKISGTLDRHSKTLVFKETEIVYSHGFQTRAYMCLVDASLQSSRSAGGLVLTGPMTSNQVDNTACTPGKIVFSNEAEINKLFSYGDRYDTVISMKKHPRIAEEPAKPAAPKTEELPQVTEKVTAGTDKSYDWYSDTVVVDAWDGGNTDGDRITILFNGKPYLSGYSLIKAKKQVRIPISGTGINTLAIVADNEGSDPPNTATLLLTDGTRKYSIVAYNSAGAQALIRIRKVK